MVSAKSEGFVSRHPKSVQGVELEAMADEQLLGLFLERGDQEAESAFRTLVVRHGPMVLGVCRHVLHQSQDAEDAFQATFLALARKGSTIRDRRVLSRWLYEVAYRVAIRARMSAMKRHTQERQGAEMSAIAPEHDPDWNELRPIVHEEVNRLPEKYRTPVVLCYLEGRTNEEVARLLDWPVGTVKGRLSRARDLLRTRLSRRGVALSIAALGVFLSRKDLNAAELPARLVDTTVRHAMDVGHRYALGGDQPPPGSTDRFRFSKRFLRLVIGSGLILLLGYAVAGLTALASTMPADGRPGVVTYFLGVVTGGPAPSGCCRAKPPATVLPAEPAPRRMRPLG